MPRSLSVPQPGYARRPLQPERTKAFLVVTTPHPLHMAPGSEKTQQHMSQNVLRTPWHPHKVARRPWSPPGLDAAPLTKLTGSACWRE